MRSHPKDMEMTFISYTRVVTTLGQEIIKLGLELKTEENEVIISSIVGRKDNFNEKGRKVNNLLKSKCTENDLGYIENTNIKVHKHLNGSGLHLNYYGTVALANNFLDVINI